MPRSRDLERKSSAYTLSDMEIFIFPDLLYALVLANIMSPRLWRWREDPWFAGIETAKPYRRLTRLKQFIMDHYAFNLDLDTWGLTTQERELARFSDFLDLGVLKQSNALFGYEGDKYYFDLDIRTHFGLNRYDGNVIPYWKTETVEAMDAFRHKPNYPMGAGECVSLAALYAAACFVVAGIPLHDLYLLATPLHSQNYIDIDDGVLTNNRRLVTRNMWFNGTELSAQARRALEHEQVTVVTHETGYIHCVYPQATIDPERYAHFSKQLKRFLCIDLTVELLDNFLRHTRDIQKCFQIRFPIHGVDHYIGLEHAFAFEQDSSFSVSDRTRSRLLAEIDQESFSPAPLPERIMLNDLELYLQEHRLDIHKPFDQARLKAQFACTCFNAESAIDRLIRFCCVQPRLPDAATQQWIPAGAPLGIELGMAREDIVSRLASIRDRNAFADLAFHAYRDLNRCEPGPYLVAALERSPVSISGCVGLTPEAMEARIRAMPDESIYDETGRLAQPDEVWNYGRGDGLEKAVLLANVWRPAFPGIDGALEITNREVILTLGPATARFNTSKGLKPQTWRLPA